jgi:hypothetical protein
MSAPWSSISAPSIVTDDCSSLRTTAPDQCDTCCSLRVLPHADAAVMAATRRHRQELLAFRCGRQVVTATSTTTWAQRLRDGLPPSDLAAPAAQGSPGVKPTLAGRRLRMRRRERLPDTEAQSANASGWDIVSAMGRARARLAAVVSAAGLCLLAAPALAADAWFSGRIPVGVHLGSPSLGIESGVRADLLVMPSESAMELALKGHSTPLDRGRSRLA